jgi:GT2 family glycosyltransferase
LTSLIIASRNRARFLQECLESVLQGDELPTEIVIVDQSDMPQPIVVSSSVCKVRHICTQSVGLSRARNAGVAAAQYDVLAFTDDDILVTRTWFGSLVQALVRAGPCAVATGRVLASKAEVSGGFAPSIVVADGSRVYEGRVFADPLNPPNMAMFRSAVEDVGPFDERLGAGSTYPAAEDNDFGFRLLEAGYRISFAPEAVVYHRAWRTQADYLPLRWSYAIGQGAYYAKYVSLSDRYMLSRLTSAMLSHLYDAACQARRRPRLAYGNLVYVLGLVVGASRWLLTQRSRC